MIQNVSDIDRMSWFYKEFEPVALNGLFISFNPKIGYQQAKMWYKLEYINCYNNVCSYCQLNYRRGNKKKGNNCDWCALVVFVIVYHYGLTYINFLHHKLLWLYENTSSPLEDNFYVTLIKRASKTWPSNITWLWFL